MFTRPKSPRRDEKKKVNAITNLIQVLSVDTLLKEHKYQLLLGRIQSLMALDKNAFESLCTALMRQLLAYCEALPESSGRYYAERGGIFEYALQRTEAALSLFTSYTLTEEQKGLSEEQRCWQYALFSASMLYGIGKLYLDYHLAFYDSNGSHLLDWNPLLGPLVSQGHYYRCAVSHESNVTFRSRLNILFANQLMPVAGFELLASNRPVFEAWLALLHEDLQGAGVLGAILSHADQIALQRAIERILLEKGEIKSRSFKTFESIEKESVKELSQHIGLTFIEWMKGEIEKGEMTFNKAPLPLVTEGLVMGDELFKWFVREHPNYKNWQAVRQGFLSLGLHDIASAQEQIIFSRFGVVLPSRAQFFNAQTGKTSWLSATEVLAKASAGAGASKLGELKQLNDKGVWQDPNLADSFLKAGQGFRG